MKRQGSTLRPERFQVGRLELLGGSLSFEKEAARAERLVKEVLGADVPAGPIPNKYRELIGVAISATTHCQYCIAYHTELARLNGAPDAEIEDAVHFAKSSAGWSTYLNGMQVDLDQFKREVKAAVAHARAQQANATRTP